MSTRKLIITAFLCGMAILVAGGIKLFITATDRVEADVLALGDEATLGEMTVSVESVTRGEDATLVTVTMSGVERGDALDGWRLLAEGEVREPIEAPVGSGDECTVTAVSLPTTCVVAFAATTVGTPVVAYLRAGEQRQWAP